MRILITGGAGFIGTNLSDRLARQGHEILVLDNLSRKGVERNLGWLVHRHGARIRPMVGDIRDQDLLKAAVRESEMVYHLAAQVAVTGSIADPIGDFEINARGTLNLLEAIRAMRHPPALLYTSTNKVLGDLADIPMDEMKTRYEPVDASVRANGISESRPIQFCSPYGCSKGAADQYVLDYSKTFGLSTVVFRMSCIYGPHQCGNEDQGWVAHFLIRAIETLPITFFGDGKQVRDVLFVEDLVDAMLLAQKDIARLKGQAFHIGGGPENTLSLIELAAQIARLEGWVPEVRMEPWRAADQRYYVSDIRKFMQTTGWRPRTSVLDGVKQLHRWLLNSLSHAQEGVHASPAA